MDIDVRKATAGDYSAVCELFDEMDALHRDHLPSMFKRPDGPARERDFYLGLIAAESVALWVAEAGGNLVGFVHAMVRDAPANPIFVPRRCVIVDSLVVRSGFQNHGIGRRLMDQAQAWAIAKGATSIELNVYEFNQNAISFYERLGYQTLSRKMNKEFGSDTAAA